MDEQVLTNQDAGGAVETSPDAATKEEPTTQPTETQAEESPGKSEDKADGSDVVDRTFKENTRLKNALSNLQKQLSGRQETPPTTTGKPQPETATTYRGDQDAANVHPALKGMEVDEDTGMVNYHGTLITPEFAMELVELKRQLQETKEWESSQASAAEDAARQKAYGELEETIGETVVSIREQKFPQLDKENGELADDILVPLTEHAIVAAVQGGEELSDALIQRETTKVFKTFSNLFTAFGQAQIASNRQHSEQYPVKPGGQPAIKGPKPLDQMTRDERLAAGTRARRAVEAGHPPG
jgi:hypothetical protein